MPIKILFISVLVVTVSASCQYNSLEAPVDCSQSELDFAVTISNTDCGLRTGVLEVIATGGKPPFSYSLDGGATQKTPIFENLAAGSYMVKVTDTPGCIAEKTAMIAIKMGLTVSATTTISDCGVANGSINVIASNGVEPYLYRLESELPQSSPDFTVGPGIYIITVTDNNGCEFVLSQMVMSNISFTTNIQPIIANSCAVFGCHDGSNSSLPNYNNFSEVKANASMIKSRTQSGNMPKTGSLSQNQIDIIACWVDDGALNN